MLAIFAQGSVRLPRDADVAMQQFLSVFLSDNNEFRPDKNETFLKSAQIPSVKPLYVEFLDWYHKRHAVFGQQHQGIVMTQGHFTKRFKGWYPQVKIPKTNRFAQCDRCLTLKEKMILAKGDLKDMYREQLARHHDDVRKDKEVYYRNRYSLELVRYMSSVGLLSWLCCQPSYVLVSTVQVCLVVCPTRDLYRARLSPKNVYASMLCGCTCSNVCFK